MDKLRIIQYQSDFDKIAHFINDEDNSEHVEVWFARELQILLGYARWENFVVAIHRAVDSCKTQSINVDDHFREVTKMIEIGNGGKHYLVLCQWQNVAFPAVKSRSDDTLLTVDTIYGQNDAHRSVKSRRDDILSTTGTEKMSSLRDFGDCSFSSFRRLKPTVNNVSSLRDFAANRQVRKYTFDPTLERRVASDEKSIEKTTQKLPKEEKTK